MRCSLVLLLLLVTAARAESLDDLIKAARENNLELHAQAALVDEADAVTRLERSALYPAVQVRGGYRHNSQVVMSSGAIFAADQQFDATVTLDVPLFDSGARGRIIALDVQADVQRADAIAAAIAVERSVVRAYYEWVGGSALVRATWLAVRTAEDNIGFVERRRASGFASEVDIARARAEAARARQRLAEARLTVAIARRQLKSLTAREITEDAPELSDDVTAEAPLDSWLAHANESPEVLAAAAARRGALSAVSRAASGLLPRIDALASSINTNAPGFYPESFWFAGVSATWQLDLRAVRTRRLARARERISETRYAIAERDARDRVTDAWNVVEAKRAGVTAAALELVAAREGLGFVQSRIDSGLATPIELLDAQRDAFAAEISTVQARANLAAARALLRLAARREVAP